MDRSLISTSRFLSLVLRHKPDVIGIELDPSGWVKIPVLIEAANATGRELDMDLLLRTVYENDKMRFAISADGKSIRANQGHSVDIDLGLRPVKPPDKLFHGTIARFLDPIRRQGLVSGNRQHVHLSADRLTAETVGKRRGKAEVLVIDSAGMYSTENQFFLSANGIWLTSHVPVDYIEFPKKG